MEKYTVIGFWYQNEPEVAGVVKGDHPILGGSDLIFNEEEDFQGPWGLTVEANSPEGAEEKAVAQMLADSAEDEDEDDIIPDGYDPTTADGPDPEGIHVPSYGE